MDADTGQIVAAALTRKEVDDASQVAPLLDQVAASVTSFTADGAYDQDSVSAAVATRHPAAAIIVPPRCTAVPSETAETDPTQRDRHLQFIAKHGRAAWQTVSGYTKRARVEATIGRFKQVIGDGLLSRTNQRRATKVDVASMPSTACWTLDAQTPSTLPNAGGVGITASTSLIPATRPLMRKPPGDNAQIAAR